MAIAAQPPKGGIVAELGGKSRPLLLRNAEIERFEDLHGIGIFAILDQMTVGRGVTVQARHVRDLVALGLVGAGMPDRAADDIVSSLPPAQNIPLRQIALDLILIAFTPEAPAKKKAGAASSKPRRAKVTAGTSPKESEASSPSD
ncbi:GTA-gp10 family protein [Limimaricola cinnabarinus]|uniref:GTA-gp10 family protein n=1 Tax=Limimaricola cinnabarinus TaxID=1125964 RepID=UPI002492026E|nr:GTA-gp10 family protein [Limimaricola cinnabarinus]